MNGGAAVLQQQGAASRYAPRVVILKDRPRSGQFAVVPKGVILHGSRSALAGNPTHAEFEGTARYQGTNAGGLGWNATIGDDEIAIHLDPGEWGWNARAASRHYLAVEFAQPRESDLIGDGQVRAFCWWLRAHVFRRWPDQPRQFPTHAEVEQSGETGQLDGKTDVFHFGSPLADELRARIAARLQDGEWIP